jgi:hypothetical protein
MMFLQKWLLRKDAVDFKGNLRRSLWLKPQKRAILAKAGMTRR